MTCHHHGISLLLQLSETVRLLCGYLYVCLFDQLIDICICQLCDLKGFNLMPGMEDGMVKNGCQMSMSWTQVISSLIGGIIYTSNFFFFLINIFICSKQCLLCGWSYQFLGHCHHLDVVTQLLWLRNGCWSMVAEVRLPLSAPFSSSMPKMILHSIVGKVQHLEKVNV